MLEWLAARVAVWGHGAKKGRVYFHCFSNNGAMTYARITHRLHARRADHGLAAVREATSRGGLVFDSAPDPNNDLELLKQVSVSTRILGRRTAPFPPFLISYRVPHGFTPRS